MIKVLGLTALLTTLLALVLSSLLATLVWLPWVLKAAITVLLIAPLGFIMGMPFPTGLKRLEDWHAPSVRWAWSLNAAASVLGSVGALISAIYLGLAQTLIIGGVFLSGSAGDYRAGAAARSSGAGAWAGARGAGKIVWRDGGKVW